MTSARGRQRLLVLGSLVAVVMALTSWPDSPPEAAHAVQPCGAGDANRATLTTSTGRTFRPCLSKVDLGIRVPRTQTATWGCGPFFTQPCYEGKWRISGVSRSSGRHTVTFADGTTEQLYRLSFQQFRVHKDLTMSTAPIGTGNPAAGYGLTLKPDLDAQLGGTGSSGEVIYTDMWVTDSSSVALDFNLLGIGYTCHGPVTVADLGAASWITVSSDGCGMDLHVRYLVTTADVGDLQGHYSVKLPRTTITVS